MANREVKVFIQGRYSTLLKELGKLAEKDISVVERGREHKEIRTRMKEVSNFASNFGVSLQDIPDVHK